MSYTQGLLYTNLTNDLLTIHQHLAAAASLKTVSANPREEETNGFPNGHPF
jgi:hypothetical protein